MSQIGVIYNIGIQSNIEGAFTSINQNIGNVTNHLGKLSQTFQKIAIDSFGFNQIGQSINNMRSSFNGLLQPGVSLNSSMADLSAITGVTGTKLKEIELNARANAKAFGTDAATSAESYKLILSKLGPEIAQSSEALKVMGTHVSILSKTMGNDSVAATEVLTTAMNQYGVDLSDPIQASKTMGEMMNVMSAAAKEGSAELPQIKAALEQAGMMAKASGVSFEELNGAIQVLDKAGKQGAEGGVAIRNVLAEFSMGRFQMKQVSEELAKYGINVETLNNKNVSMADKLKLLAPLQKDTALITKMFGKENEAAAIALIQNVGQMEIYTKKIKGTQSATEQANVVMSSYAETNNRIKAVFDDLKISFFNATSAAMPFE